MATPSEGVTRFDKMVSKTKRKYYMLDKKEGIGKTSYAASLRVKFADSEHPILVVSDDPTHSLNNSFAQALDKIKFLSLTDKEIFSESNDTKLEIQVHQWQKSKSISMKKERKHTECRGKKEHKEELNFIFKICDQDIIALAIDMKPACEIRTRQGLSMIQEIIVINQESVSNEIVLKDVIRQKSYLNSASSSTTPSEEDVIEIAKIENLLPEIN
ncbi:hypothetical protein Dsin_009091 [Dipteronia sinensis]|uniref:ArsA/GET3 Anion-transporting ATPase-like domain-containing protein n=1 Tax=Dipteronia sinensis TaxID=43782 RepID=A0AAE0EBF1_9ROSI|nr:hypothetical protein Dsin_009091 [Dipteronia sinensis]